MASNIKLGVSRVNVTKPLVKAGQHGSRGPHMLLSLTETEMDNE